MAKASDTKKKILAVCLVVNSPGGSACQSSIMGSKVQVFAQKRNVPFFTFAEDLAASGGYWLLCSGKDGVYANKNSLIGSIGVVSITANLRNLLNKTEIERPVIQTSEKLISNRFDPLKEGGLTEQDETYIKGVQSHIFTDFRAWVESNREGKLKEDEFEKIFSADVFLGTNAKELGLIDEFGEMNEVMTEKYGAKVKIVNFSKTSPFAKLAENFSTRATFSLNL